jgi:hypothetical protein
MHGRLQRLTRFAIPAGMTVLAPDKLEVLEFAAGGTNASVWPC